MKKSLLFIVGIIVFIISSCEYKYIDPIEVDLPDEPVSFASQIEPVLDNNCGRTCHASTNPILTLGNSYKSLTEGGYLNVSDPESSLVIQKLNESSHSTKLNATERALLLKWIEEGAENN